MHVSRDQIAEEVRAAVMAGEIEQAIALYEEAARDSGRPDRFELLAQFGFLLWQCYDYCRAGEVFAELQSGPHVDARVLQQIASLYFRIGRFDVAAEVMRGAVSRCATDGELLFQLASCLERCDRVAEATETAQEALEIDPTHRASVRLLAHIDKRLGNCPLAISRIESHLARYPDGETWALKYELAACLDRVAQYDRAWNALLEAKAQVAAISRADLVHSYSIRRRQGELAKRLTDSDLRRWHHTPVDDRIPIVLLAGFPRSGTTLLESILTAHPGIVGTDESGIIASQFVQPIVWQAKDELDALLEIRGLSDRQIEIGRETYLKYTTAVLGQSIDGQILVEKDPLLTCDLALPLRLFPEARIVMPLRDPRDVAISFFFTMVPFQWNSSPSTSIVETARFYHDVMRHWLLLRHRLPWPWIETRYEDMVAQPQREIGRVTEFFGIDFQEMMLDPSRRKADRMITTPTYIDVTRPIHRKAVGRWKHYCRYLEPARPILEAWAREFGYD